MKRITLSPELRQFLLRRTKDHVNPAMELNEMLASAYIQGAADALVACGKIDGRTEDNG
jgi:hypothetical protein